VLHGAGCIYKALFTQLVHKIHRNESRTNMELTAVLFALTSEVAHQQSIFLAMAKGRPAVLISMRTAVPLSFDFHLNIHSRTVVGSSWDLLSLMCNLCF